MSDGRVKPWVDEAELHLGRAEHQVFVSLKYTRTGDVMINFMNRIVECLEAGFNALLMVALKENKIEELPTAIREKMNKVKQIYKDEIIEKAVELYRFLNSFMKGIIGSENDYRKDVTLIGIVGNKEERVNIEILTSFYYIARDFVNYIKNVAQSYIEEEKEEDKEGIDIF